MVSIFVSSMQYIQGPDVISRIGELLGSHGKKVMLISDLRVLSIIESQIKESMKAAEIDLVIEVFSGECTHQEINRLSLRANETSREIILAAGGGKALDTGKAVAGKVKAISAVLPTTASTDSPTTSIAVTYKSDHTYEGVLILNKNPDFVFVDSQIISQAPARFLVAGMGDAIATKFEANACRKSLKSNMKRGSITQAGLTLADLSYSIVREFGLNAKLSAEKNLVTPALENIIEANILLSGLGWENCGVAVAHAFNGASSCIPRTHEVLHGERVAFGLLIQLVLENRSSAEIHELLSFYHAIGLPMTFSDIGMSEPNKNELEIIVKQMLKPGSHAHNMPFPLDEEIMMNAIILADSIGSHWKFNKVSI